MPFVLYCIDKPNRAAQRAATRAAHLAYVSGRPSAFLFGGPLQDESGRVRGSLMILDLPDRAALDAHLRGDPFFGADLFESVTVWATRQVVPEREPGGLSRELQAAQAAQAAATATATSPGRSA